MQVPGNMAVFVKKRPKKKHRRGEPRSLKWSGGVGYQVPKRRPRLIELDGCVLSRDSESIGITAGCLTDVQLAFLTLLVMDRTYPGAAGIQPADSRQRHRVAERLGMSVVGLRKWAQRNLFGRPSHFVIWLYATEGRQASRTGGPWRITASEVLLHAKIASAQSFIDTIRARGVHRSEGPERLLQRAITLQSQEKWAEAETLLAEAEAMFERRRWQREDLLWLEILLQHVHVQMQLGRVSLTPAVAERVLHSVSRQGLGGPQVDLVRSRAHYLAALIHAQGEWLGDLTPALEHLELARELVVSGTTEEAERQFWRAGAFRELLSARITGETRPKTTSVILQASRAVPEDREQELMRYGETLLYGGKPEKAIEYASSALEGPGLSKPAWIIAERVKVASEWATGTAKDAVLDKLDGLTSAARSLRFANQVRILKQLKKVVIEGERDVSRILERYKPRVPRKQEQGRRRRRRDDKSQ